MELSAKYAYAVYETKSFSAAAKALFVSQPALSSMIAKLERSLGFKIFDRSTAPLTITPKGQIYIDMLTEVRESEQQMTKRLEQFSTKPIKQLSVGTSLFLADSILPEVCARFGKIYPDLHIKLNMGAKGSIRVLNAMLDGRDVDVLIGEKYLAETESADPICRTKTIVAARCDLEGIDELLPYAISREDVLSGSYPREIGNSELPLFNDVKFITTDKVTNYTRRITALLGGNYSLSHISIKNLRHLGANYEMMRAGLGATIATDIDLAHPIFDDKRIVYFAFKGQNNGKSIYAVRRRGEELSAEAIKFIEVFKEVLAEFIGRAAKGK